MKITEQDRRSLILTVSSFVRGAIVTDWGTEFPKDLDELHISDALANALAKALGGEGLERFIHDSLHRRILASEFPVEPKLEYKLDEIPGFDDPISVAEIILEDLSRFPNQYNIIVRGPKILSDRISNKDFHIKISDRLEITTAENISKYLKFHCGNCKIDEWRWW